MRSVLCSSFSGMSKNTITCLMREPIQFSAYTQITAKNMRYSGILLGFICIPAVLNESGVLCCWVRVWFSTILQSQGLICLIVHCKADLTGYLARFQFQMSSQIIDNVYVQSEGQCKQNICEQGYLTGNE